MTHAQYVALFERLAKAHAQIAHTQDLGQGPRNSFFRFNKEADFYAALGNNVHFPALCLGVVTSRLDTSRGVVDDLLRGSFEIRTHVGPTPSATVVDAARDQCKQVGMMVLAYISQQCEDLGNCAPVEGFELPSVRVDFTGPIGTGEYGARFAFAFRDEAFDLNQIDFSTEFPYL